MPNEQETTTAQAGPVVHRHGDKTPGAWDRFINAMTSGEEFECDEEMFYYWLEVLPPAFMGRVVTFPDGKKVKAYFGFAEGEDRIVAFWMIGQRGLKTEPLGGVVCKITHDDAPGSRYFGRRTDIINRG